MLLVCVYLVDDTLIKLIILRKNNITMKIIISPAKKLTNKIFTAHKNSSIQFLNEATYLVDQLKHYSVNDIKEKMNLSDTLAKLNHDRYQRWDLDAKDINPAIYMFQGDVYKGLKADQFSEEDLDFAQDNLRIISGLYGLLKPLDLIFPYRLEMGTKMKTDTANNLYDFWGDKLYQFLYSEMEPHEALINLASNEYSRALQLEHFSQSVITPVFKDYKNGKLKVISFFAKKARGEMANFIIKNKILETSDLRLFVNDGYKFSEQNGTELLFTR